MYIVEGKMYLRTGVCKNNYDHLKVLLLLILTITSKLEYIDENKQ